MFGRIFLLIVGTKFSKQPCNMSRLCLAYILSILKYPRHHDLHYQTICYLLCCELASCVVKSITLESSLVFSERGSKLTPLVYKGRPVVLPDCQNVLPIFSLPEYICCNWKSHAVKALIGFLCVVLTHLFGGGADSIKPCEVLPG